MQMGQAIEILSAAKAPKKDGKGNAYADLINCHMPLLEAMQTASRKAFKRHSGDKTSLPPDAASEDVQMAVFIVIKASGHKENRKSANEYLTQTIAARQLLSYVQQCIIKMILWEVYNGCKQ